MADIHTYREFWLHYLREHSRASSQALHNLGTTLTLGCLVLLGATGWWGFLPAAVVADKGFAWSGRFFIEHSRPATFTYPAWTLFSGVAYISLHLPSNWGRNCGARACPTVV